MNGLAAPSCPKEAVNDGRDGPVSLPKILFRRSVERKPPHRGSSPANSMPQRGRTGSGPGVTVKPMSYVEAARKVLDKAALAADVAAVATAAGGITAPAALAAKGLGWVAEGALLGVNAYDATANGRAEPLWAQVTSFPSRLLPGGRALQRTLKLVRGPAGPLRNNIGRYRRSHFDNEGVKEAGDVFRDRYVQALTDEIFDDE